MACASPDLEEASLVDLSTCLRNELACEKTGGVGSGEVLGSEAVRLSGNGSIALPIGVHGKKLAWIAIGLHAEDSVRNLAVTVDGIPGAVVSPSWGFTRVEIAQNDAVPAANARLHLVAQDGTFEVLWVVGRFRD